MKIRLFVSKCEGHLKTYKYKMDGLEANLFGTLTLEHGTLALSQCRIDPYKCSDLPIIR